ncbi:extracellular solute-binding protein (plasmid) [Rhizobium ruizarguesonis]|uniref:Extracellular solute-binding protein n=1 Tax=Rhizobium leguminosarum TaxID=384 RepID=A0A7M3DJ31_RHILE|nr:MULTISPECIES: extracellular solute-binding protein [Rhizobium]TAU15532.1 extracellular solute-binding protein [Rhizobium ruizarguesonis]TAU37012.1 extracellular solute-binding protein [Rhizobium leguminosarum]TAU59122.1 extracellular solute-binding protein [Rhizobium ruizarguesonis]TAV03336.1 extracellular solute-binding protein [Rhizobium ruizarguesonis]TAV22505.1 extracellular solute-binding protein [Rhizobium ruizarguesonis]
MTIDIRNMSRRDLLKSASVAALVAGAGSLTIPRRGAAQDANTVRVLSVEDPFFFSMKALVPEYEKETGIKVELESLSYDALQSRLVSAFVAKTSDADVIVVDQMWLGQYLDNGWIISLNDFIAKDSEFDLSDFIPEVLYSSNMWRGQIGTLPVAAYAQGVMYRKDVFDELGIAAPPTKTSEDWTWTKYVDTLKSMEGKSFGGKPLFPTVVCGSQPSPIVHMFTQVSASHGANWFKSFPADPWDFSPQLTSPAWVKSVEVYRQLYKLSPPEAINYVWFDAGTRFAKGDIGMFYWWTPYFYLIKNSGYMTGKKSDVIDKYATAALPKAEGVPQTVSLGGWSLGIPSSSERQEAGYAFIKWATSKATQKKMALWPDLNYQFSDFARVSLYEDEEVKALYPYLDVQYAMMKQGNGKVTRPPVPGYTAIESVLGLTLNQLLTGSEEPKTGLERANSLFESILKGNLMIPYQKASYADTLDGAKALIAKR